MRIITIPGQTGCLAVRKVPKPTHRRKTAQAPKKVATPTTATNVLPNGESRFSGGTLEKKNKNTMTYRRYKRNVMAHNARQHSHQRSFRESFRLYLRLTIR